MAVDAAPLIVLLGIHIYSLALIVSHTIMVYITNKISGRVATVILF